MTVTVKAYAKLNLYLDITGTMDNGYHYLDNLTQSVSVYDTVKVEAEKSEVFECTVACNNPDIPCDEKNIVFKAAKEFCKRADFAIKAKIDIEKNIPLMGGMGGSSVDGAAVLAALGKIFGGLFTDNELCGIGRKIGADVPLCLIGGTLYSQKDGSDMKTLEIHDSCYFVCVQPSFSLNTAEAYAMYDSLPVKTHGGLAEYTDKLAQYGYVSASDSMYNVFSVLYNDKRLEEISSRLSEAGAAGTLMTGSGSVVFGVFDNKEKAENAVALIKNDYPTVFICVPVSKGTEFIG